MNDAKICAARQAWHQLQATAARYGATWLVCSTKRAAVIARALVELDDMGSGGLVLAIEGYAHRTRAWDRQMEYFTPESIFRPENLAKNVEAGLLARKEARANELRKAAEESLSRSGDSLWD